MTDRMLSLALREAQQAEVFEAVSESVMVHFEANRLKQVERRQSRSIALRLVRDGRLGFASAGGAVEDVALVRMAVDTSSFGAAARFAFPGPQEFLDVAVHDVTAARLDTDALVSVGNGIIEKVCAHEPLLRCEGVVSVGSGVVRITNSAGLDASYRKTNASLFMEGIRVNGTDMLFVGDSLSSSVLFPDVDMVVSTMLLQLDRASRNASISTGTYPVLFTPHGVSAALLMPLAVAFNGKNVVDGASRLAGRQGEQLFDAGFSLRDDATIAMRAASSPFDDEGTRTRPNPLIEGGVVRGFLYDLQTAADAGAESPGSGHRADARSQIRPGMSAFVVEPGRVSFEEMLAGIDEGLVVDELIGAGQGNLLAGDFGGNVLLGYKVEKGKITGRVKNTMISGNVMDALGSMVVVGADARWVGGNLWSPSILCQGVSVSSGGGEA
ncbi:MAG: TldD/PmbA family protein [Dehalococcoidia bacterium]|nr:TldD/PmbA family protein [Dehalococcoidia bacterium]